jgi:hypothetical protein
VLDGFGILKADFLESLLKKERALDPNDELQFWETTIFIQ